MRGEPKERYDDIEVANFVYPNGVLDEKGLQQHVEDETGVCNAKDDTKPFTETASTALTSALPNTIDKAKLEVALDNAGKLERNIGPKEEEVPWTAWSTFDMWQTVLNTPGADIFVDGAAVDKTKSPVALVNKQGTASAKPEVNVELGNLDKDVSAMGYVDSMTRRDEANISQRTSLRLQLVDSGNIVSMTPQDYKKLPNSEKKKFVKVDMGSEDFYVRFSDEFSRALESRGVSKKQQDRILLGLFDNEVPNIFFWVSDKNRINAAKAFSASYEGVVLDGLLLENDVSQSDTPANKRNALLEATGRAWKGPEQAALMEWGLLQDFSVYVTGETDEAKRNEIIGRMQIAPNTGLYSKESVRAVLTELKEARIEEIRQAHSTNPQ